jgi:phage-related holin
VDLNLRAKLFTVNIIMSECKMHDVDKKEVFDGITRLAVSVFLFLAVNRFVVVVLEEHGTFLHFRLRVRYYLATLFDIT